MRQFRPGCFLKVGVLVAAGNFQLVKEKKEEVGTKRLPAPVEGFLSTTPKLKSIDVPFWRRYKYKFPMSKLLASVFGLVLIFFGLVFWWNQNTKPAATYEVYQSFIIPRGYSASQIGNKLEDEDLIKDSLAFKFYVQLTGRAGKIQAGEYRLTPSFNLFEIAEQLTKGPVEVWVTIPEGFRREEIAERFINSLGKEDEEAIVFREEFLNQTRNLEGFLFPDTYLFPKTASASAVANKLRDIFDKRVETFTEDIEKGQLTLDEVITLASIIERETKTDNERPIVAGILLNRLAIGMGLQADATVQHAVASTKCRNSPSDCSWWPILTGDDLKVDSLYNTYRYRGLPPSPIANPGVSSISSAVYPEETDYLYYLHDSSGQAHFAETLEEHNENIEKYLKD